MTLLQVTDFPDDIYNKIFSAALRENKTIAQQTIALIKKGLGNEETNRERRKKVLERIMARNISEAAKAIDDVKLIHEDHER